MISLIRKTSGKIQSVNNIDNIIFKAGILGIILIIFIQISLCNKTVKSIIGANNNIIPLNMSEINNPPGWVEIKVERLNWYNDLLILKNGEVDKDIIKKDDIIRIEVYNGDVIELMALDYHENINIQIYDVGSNIIAPEKGERFESNNNILYLFQTNMNKSLIEEG